jgi:hypothetical protein
LIYKIQQIYKNHTTILYVLAKPYKYIMNQTTPCPLLVKEGSYDSYLIKIMDPLIIKTFVLNSPPCQGGVAEGRGGFRLPQDCSINI